MAEIDEVKKEGVIDVVRAIDIKNKFVKKEMHDECGVVVITSEAEGKNMTWEHIHDDEKLPEGDIAIHVNR